MSEMLKGFCIQKGYRGREVNAVLDGAHALGVEVVWSAEPVDGCVPVGTVEWCAPAFGECRIDFFPEFLKERLHRRVSRQGLTNPPCPVFVKDATAWKSDFESGPRTKQDTYLDGSKWISEMVTFVQEWRYYVAAGRVVTTGWYDGADEDEPAPELGIEWPAGFSGAVDFGRLDDGRIALVECHAPFACGWYGEKHEDYARWLWESWKDRSWWLTE